MTQVSVPVSVLRNTWDVVETPLWEEPFRPLTKTDVLKAVEQKNWTARHMRPLKNNLETREFDHAIRIAWMVIHPPREPVIIDTNQIYPLIDGYHRLYAAIIRGDEMINASISGCHKDIIKLFGHDVLAQIIESDELNSEMQM